MECMKYVDFLKTYSETSLYINEDIYLPGLRESAKKGEDSKNNHLDICLKKLFPNNTFQHRKFIKLEGDCVKNLWYSKICVDYICEDLKIVVEFDGESWQGGGHFTDPTVCLKDQYNTRILTDMGYKVIRIPFYVQLDKYAIKYYFDIDYKDQLYETCTDHGFLFPDCKTPAFFCELGLKRFYNDLLTLPKEITRSIIVSIMARFTYNIQTFSSNIMSDRYILPTNLYSYIGSVCNQNIINICKFITIDNNFNYWLIPADYDDFITPLDGDMLDSLMLINCGYNIDEYAMQITRIDEDTEESICYWKWKTENSRREFIDNFIKTS